MPRTSRVIKIFLAIAGVLTTAIAAAEGDYKADQATFAKSYKHIDIEPVWTKDGDLVQPKNFRRWVFIGAPLTPHALNGG